MKLSHRLTAAAVAISMGAGLLAAPIAARASEEGRRNTALGLGAAAAALLLTQRDKVPGLIAGAGAAYAYKKYQDKVNERHRWERYGDYYYRGDRNRYDDRYYRDRNDGYGRYDGYGSYDRYGRNDRYGHYNRNDRYGRNDRYYRDRRDGDYRSDRYGSRDRYSRDDHRDWNDDNDD